MIYIKHQMFDVDSINVKQMEYIITFDNLEYEEEFFIDVYKRQMLKRICSYEGFYEETMGNTAAGLLSSWPDGVRRRKTGHGEDTGY